MSMKEDYEIYMKRRKKRLKEPMSEIWMDRESRYMHPFQMYGNLYYVGDNWVCVHLIDTGEGLLLIDGGNCGATAMLIQSIWEAGFNPADVKWMILSHGHVDHIGAAVFFKKMFGTQLLLGAPDAKMFEENPEQSVIQESTDYADTLFKPDVLIQDNDVMTFGNTTIQFYLVPGHTAGCIACFFDIHGEQGTKRAGYYGGFGFNTLLREFLKEIGDPTYQMRQTYLDSLKKVRDQPVDVFMGNHTNNNKLVEKRLYMQEHPGENPFIDNKAWASYLDEKRDSLLSFMKDPANL